MGHILKPTAFKLNAGSVSIFGELSEKVKKNKKSAALGTTPLALILSACGSNDGSTTTSSNVLTLTKSADIYSASSVTGFTVADSSSAKFDVADSTANAYEIKLDASGTGVLEFDFVDAGDTVTLLAGSKTTGFTTLKVSDGTLDATNADLTGITRVEVASGIKISLAQIKDIPTIVANSATSQITVEVTTEAEATELVSLISAGTVQVFAATNPIKLVAAPTATVTTEVLSTKETETTASVKPVADAPVDTSATDTTADSGSSTDDSDTSSDTGTSTDTTTDTTTGTTTGGGGGGGSSGPVFSLLQSTPGVFIVGTENGNVTVSESGGAAMFAPATGVNVNQAGVTGLVVDSITLTTTSVLADGMTITGGGNIALTALEGDAAADLSGITSTGTRTVNVADDVTFTGDLGTFAVTVDTGKTLTTTAAIATGLTMTGAGGVAVTALAAATDLSNITVSGSKTANVAADVTFTGDLGTFGVTVDTGKTLTTTSAKATGLTMTGGSVAISDVIAADIDITAIASTVDFSQADVTIATSKTLTLTAAQAATEVFSGAGTLAVTASTSDDVFTATAAVLSLATGTGDDVVTAGAAAKITAADAINLGGGTADVLVISADGTSGAVFDEAGYVGAETIRVDADGTTASTNGVVTLTHSADFDQNTIIDASGMSDSGADFTLAVTTASRVTGDLHVKASGGTNTLAGGIGNDTFEFGAAATFTAADAVVAGAGADVIQITADANSTGAIVDDGNTGVETIRIAAGSVGTEDAKVTLNFGSQVTAALSINASLMTNSAAAFTLALDGTNHGNVDGALTVVGGAGNDTISGGDGIDVITGSDGKDTLTGKGGIDKFRFDADDSASVSDTTAGDATGSDHINDYGTGSANDLIVITGELANGFSSATDVLVGTGTENTDTAVVADVADFLTSTYLVARDGVIDNGFDTAIKVTTDGSTVAFSDAAAALAATAFDVTVASGATVILGANNDTATGTTGNETITGGAGVDTLDGGAGNDTFIIGTSHDGTAESYTGGDGVADKLDVNAAANLSNDTLATIEILDLDASGTAVAVTMTDAQVDMLTSITSAASAIGTGDKITLSAAMTSDMLDGTVIGGSDDDEIIFILADAANALTLVDASMGASDKLYIDGSAAGSSNALTFIGTAEDDAAVLTVKGGAAEDTIMGGDGADVITGGTGADILTGDAGVDFFVYADQDAAVGTVAIANGGSALTSLATSTTTAAIAAGDTFTGLEVITDLDSTDSSGEKITLGNTNVAINTSVLALANNKAIVVQGTYGSDVFTVGTSGTTGADSVLIWDGDSSGNCAWNAIVLQGVDSTDEAVYAISSGDFIA